MNGLLNFFSMPRHNPQNQLVKIGPTKNINMIGFNMY
jgi:hypothetical protein